MCSDGMEETGDYVAPPLMICRANSCNDVGIITTALRYISFADSHAEWPARSMSTVPRSEQNIARR